MKKIDLRNQKLVKQLLDDAYLNILVDPETIWNPLRKIPDEFADYPHLYIQWLMTQPEYFHFMCREIMNIDLQPFQCVILKEMWNRKFPFLIGSRGMSKSFLLSLYTTLRLLILRNRKVVVCGAAFRQSKILFEYMKTFYSNAPLLRDIIHGMGPSETQGPHRDVDMCTFVMGDSLATFLPIGTGDKIRGQRANDIITDEINSINQEILEKVIFGFAAVKSSPSEGVKQEAKKAIVKQLGLDHVVTGDELYRENQIIMSGTCGFTFQHMYGYWKKWRDRILTKGDPKKIYDLFNGDVPIGFDWTHYSIMRIPFESLPRGFMDEGIVAQAKSSVDKAQYLMEYSACFSGDSNGFFKRSLIESCTVTNSNKISHRSEQDIIFYPLLYGNRECKYVYGIDPASESDKFAIVILEIHPEHRRLVYSWTSNKKDFQEDLKEGHIKHTNDFYTYCLYKIRDLMKRFPCELMVMDAQGGGYMIAEGLKSKDLIKDGEMPILPVIIDGKPQDTDGIAGLHILELSNNSDYKWYAQANHGLRKDMEDKALLFPHVDPTTLELATISDNIAGRLVDRLDDVVLEIEELKNELSTIVHSATPSGRERWDTPEIKLAGKQKGRLRKDRYSALFIANMGARVLQNSEKIVFDFATGDFAGSTKANSGRTFTGPAWMVDKLNDLYSD
jgi:hypothetical protein